MNLKNYFTQRVVYIVLYAVSIGILTALVCWFFNWNITYFTELRRNLGVVPYLCMPLAGFLIAYYYSHSGKDIQKGSDLIIDEIHFPSKRIPFKIVPSIFFSTILSHFVGASIGKEGVAVQIGAGIADQLPHNIVNRKMILMMGMSAGFSAIFGTPMAGAIFGIEVMHSGTLSIKNFIPTLIAAISGYFISTLLPFSHLTYPDFTMNTFKISYFVLAIFGGLFFGIVARFFKIISHGIKNVFDVYFNNIFLRALLGSFFIFLIYYFSGSDKYLGIGTELLSHSFSTEAHSFDFLIKIFSTAISIGSVFKGGEVTPLFIIGATAGNFLAQLTQTPIVFLTSLGFLSVFAGAANVPFTCLVLGCEIFGINIFPYAFLAIVFSYLMSGNRSIYSSQRMKFKKI
jgi:H+/Cl- antiporter ClcA